MLRCNAIIRGMAYIFSSWLISYSVISSDRCFLFYKNSKNEAQGWITMKVKFLRKAGIVVAALLLVACAKEDPAVQKERLQQSIARLDKAIASYKERGLEGVEELQQMRKGFEEELQALDAAGDK